MVDCVFQKLEQHVTGSLIQKKEQPKVNIIIDDPVEASSSVKSDSKQVDLVMEKILELDWVGESLKKNHTPVYFLDTKKTTWLYSISKMTFYPVPAGSEITLLDAIADNKVTCIIGNDIYEVNTDMVTLAGWN